MHESLDPKCAGESLMHGGPPRHGAEQYAGNLECVFYGYHLDRAILKIAEAAYCLMPSLAGCVLLDPIYPRVTASVYPTP